MIRAKNYYLWNFEILFLTILDKIPERAADQKLLLKNVFSQKVLSNVNYRNYSNFRSGMI